MTGHLRLGLAAIVAVLAVAAVVGPSAAQQPGRDVSDNGLVLVMDASGSMVDPAGNGQNRMQAAQDAAVSLVRELPDDARVGLVAYGHRIDNTNDVKSEGCRDVETIRPVQPLDRRGLVRDIRSFGPSGWTPIARSLQQAGDELDDVDGARTVVLISDGIDTCAPPDPCDVAADLATEGIDLTVETIGFQVDDQARDQLECIAEATGGSYRDAPDAAALGESIRALSLRAFRTYDPTGEPITGGRDAADATEMQPGTHLDEIVAGEPRFYSFDVPDERNFALSAVAVGQPGRETESARLRLFVDDPDVTCGEFTAAGPVGESTISTGLVGGPDEDCDEGGPFTAQVLLTDYEPDEGANQPFPLELRLIEFTPGASLRPPEGTTMVGPGAEPAAGASYASAPLVEPGTYAGNIRTDEKLFYAVEVQRGQSLSVRATAEPSASSGDGRLYTALENAALQGGRFGDESTQGGFDFAFDEGGSTTIEPGVAGEDASNQVLERPALFYVSTTLVNAPETALVDYELTIDVTGQPIPDPTPSPTAAPTPSPGAAASPTTTATPSPSATPTADDPTADPTGAATSDAEPDDGGGSGVPWVLLGLLALAVVGGGAWAAGRRSGGGTTTDTTQAHDHPDGGA